MREHANVNGMSRAGNAFDRSAMCLIGFVVCVIVWASEASAQERYVKQVRAQLESIQEKLADDEFERTHSFKIDKLPADGSDTFSLTLKKETDYVLVSACDADCSDLDIKVYDENDNEVAQDTTVDDLAMVSVTPRWTGQFRIEITMFSCDDDPCYYGIGVFGR